MKIDFTGKKAIVCGGSKGIGKVIAESFAACGGDVSICARDLIGLEAAKKDISKHGNKVHIASTDLSIGENVRTYISSAINGLGGLDFLVNNASAFGFNDNEQDWSNSFAVDMLSVVHATQEALEALKSSKGCVLNISSLAANYPSTRHPPYGAMKAAVVHYSRTQAAMYAEFGIRVNCISPGSIEFPGGLWDKRKNDNPDLYNQVLSSIPFGRLGTPEEIANVALFLASPYASWVTGQVITVDGGQSF